MFEARFKEAFRWLGRQVGHVRKGVQYDPAPECTVYRRDTVETKPLPQDPNVKLRRTTIDEIIVKKNDPKNDETMPND